MAIDYPALAAELTAGHPVTGAYSADNQIAADELNAVNRPAESDALAILQYLFEKKHRTQQGSDTVFTPVIGRLYDVARSNVGGDPFGRGLGNELNLQQIHAAQSFLVLFDSPHAPDMDLSDSNLPLGYLNGAGIISPAQGRAIENLSANQQSRLRELRLGRAKVDGHHVATARAL